MVTEQTGIERFVRLDQIDKVVRNALAGGRGRFVRADVHPAVDLAGIGREDVGVEPLGDFDSNAAFPDGGRAENNDQWFAADLSLRQ